MALVQSRQRTTVGVVWLEWAIYPDWY